MYPCGHLWAMDNLPEDLINIGDECYTCVDAVASVQTGSESIRYKWKKIIGTGARSAAPNSKA